MFYFKFCKGGKFLFCIDVSKLLFGSLRVMKSTKEGLRFVENCLLLSFFCEKFNEKRKSRSLGVCVFKG